MCAPQWVEVDIDDIIYAPHAWVEADKAVWYIYIIHDLIYGMMNCGHLVGLDMLN